jgi:2-oxoisovalerate dehydrogenase E1 component alpha subunit
MQTIANFSISYQQFIDPQGQLTQALPDFATAAELIELYRLMTLIRLFDLKAVALQRTGRIGTYSGILGQEAISVAMGRTMKPEDVFCPYYREFGTMIQRGVKMSDILTYWGGDERGNTSAYVEDFPFSVPIASQCLHATGIATAFKIRKQARVAVTAIGDGGTSKGDFYEALNLAGTWHLPVVFVINNNQWAISSPRKSQSSTLTLAQKAIAGGFEGVQVDGNDVIAVYAAMEEALHKARTGGGPSLIEAITYRLCDHTTADDAKRYCPPEELADGWKNEPLIRLRTYLEKIEVWSAEKEAALRVQCSQEVEAAVIQYTSQKAQSPESMFDYLYAELPEALKSQRAVLLEGLK